MPLRVILQTKQLCTNISILAFRLHKSTLTGLLAGLTSVSYIHLHSTTFVDVKNVSKPIHSFVTLCSFDALLLYLLFLHKFVRLRQFWLLKFLPTALGSGCVAQLVERSLPIPDVRGSTPVIGKIY